MRTIAEFSQKSLHHVSACGGFTLIESLVSLSIVTLAIVGPISLASTSINASRVVREQLTAFYLAQEGIEIIRNERDINRLFVGAPGGDAEGEPDSSNWGDGWLSLCSGNGCELLVDATETDLDYRIKSCNDSICTANETVLTYNSEKTLYGREATQGWESSPYSRKVSVEKAQSPNEDKEAIVTVTVQWTASSLRRSREVVVTEHLFDL